RAPRSCCVCATLSGRRRGGGATLPAGRAASRPRPRGSGARASLVHRVDRGGRGEGAERPVRIGAGKGPGGPRRPGGLVLRAVSGVGAPYRMAAGGVDAEDAAVAIGAETVLGQLAHRAEPLQSRFDIHSITPLGRRVAGDWPAQPVAPTTG